MPKLKVGTKEWYKYLAENHCYGVVPTAMLEGIFKTKAELNKFYKWMSGQTQSIHGVYPTDLKYYLEHKSRGEKDPYVWD